MKRRVLFVLLLLMAGSLINVAVAWALAWYVHANTLNPLQQGWTMRQAITPSKRTYTLCTHWHVREFSSPGSSLIVVTCVGSPWGAEFDFDDLLPPVSGIRDDIRQFEANAGENDHPGYLYWDGRGWPFIAMATYWPWFDSTKPDPPIVGGIALEIPSQSNPWPYELHDLHALPLRPVWPGFAINTAFYAAMLWLALASPSLLRRAKEYRRIKCGLCPKCAYPVGTNERCTECGATHEVKP